MVLVASVLFVLLEGARVQEIKRISKQQTVAALESVFANYNTLLWEEYQLLASDSTHFEEDIIFYGNSRFDTSNRSVNMLRTQVENAEITQLTLLTDANGAVFAKIAADSMEETLGFGMAKELFNRYEVVKDLLEGSNLNKSWIDSGAAQGSVIEGYHPLKIIQALQSLGILELVLADTGSISKNTVVMDNLISNRVRVQGISPQIEDVNWMEGILFQQYLLKQMSHYGNPQEERGFSYELEYIIGGANSDVENLKTVLTQMIFIREVINFLYITLDPTKYEEASVLALGLVGFSANPFVIESVKLGLLAAWAYGESVLDIRALLQGKKIPLLKSKETWTLQLNSIGAIAEKSFCAKEAEWGFSYEDYLGILLLMQQNQMIALRAMDAVEANLRKQLGDSSFCLDTLLVQAEVEMNYCYRPVFYTGYMPWSQIIKTKANYSYR